MSPVSAIIADDEPLLRDFLRKLLGETWPDLHILGEAANGDEALVLIKEKKPDIAFLDIRMPGISGLEVGARVAGKCRVVFITAYDEYAVTAFEQEAVDYLLKPVRRERLAKTVERLKKEVASSRVPGQEDALRTLAEQLASRREKIFLQWLKVQQGDGIRLVAVADVSYFQADHKYTRVISTHGEDLIRIPIKELTEKLDPEKFWRIHRGTIVNTARIKKTTRTITGGYAVILHGLPEKLPVSRSYAHLFRQM